MKCRPLREKLTASMALTGFLIKGAPLRTYGVDGFRRKIMPP
jgi:hypothetical protein